MNDVALVMAAGMALAVLSVGWVWRASAQASIIEQLQRAMSTSQERQDAQANEIDDLKYQINELHEERLADRVLIQEWIAYARQAWALLREATGQEPPPEPAARARRVTPGDLARLARSIETRFSLDEINNLAFELGIDNALEGGTLTARATSLVNVARRRGLLVRLIELCQAERPNGGF